MITAHGKYRTGIKEKPQIEALFTNWWRKRRIERHRLRTLSSLRQEPDWLLEDIGVCRTALEAALCGLRPSKH